MNPVGSFSSHLVAAPRATQNAQTNLRRPRQPQPWSVGGVLKTLLFGAVALSGLRGVGASGASIDIPSGNDCTPYLENAENGSGFGTLWAVFIAFNNDWAVGNQTINYLGEPITSTTFVSESVSSPLRQICAEPPGLEVEYIKASAVGVMLDTLGNNGVNRTALDPLIYAGDSAGAVAQLKADLGIVDNKPWPTSLPSGSPTSLPFGSPTSLPTGSPTGSPTGFPTGSPTQIPSLYSPPAAPLGQVVYALADILKAVFAPPAGRLRGSYNPVSNDALTTVVDSISALQDKISDQDIALNKSLRGAQSFSSTGGVGGTQGRDGGIEPVFADVVQNQGDTITTQIAVAVALGLVTVVMALLRQLNHHTMFNQIIKQSRASIDGTIDSSESLSEAHKISFKFAISDYINNGSIYPLFDTIQRQLVRDTAHTVAQDFSEKLMDLSERTEHTIHPGPWWFGQNPIDGQAARALTLALMMKCVTSGRRDFKNDVPNAVGKINLSVWRNFGRNVSIDPALNSIPSRIVNPTFSGPQTSGASRNSSNPSSRQLSETSLDLVGIEGLNHEIS